MQARQILIIAVSLLIVSSCRKKDDGATASYYPLTPGNYWVYQTFRLDSNYNIIEPASVIDSAYVEKDTTISGKVFHKYIGPNERGSGDYVTRYLRDSLGYLKDNRGNLYFTSRDFNTTFYRQYLVDLDHNISMLDTPCLVERKMGERDKMVMVPAGTFRTSSYQEIYFMDPYFASFAPVVRTLHTRYAAGIGMVAQTLPFYINNPSYTERRLIRYRVQ